MGPFQSGLEPKGVIAIAAAPAFNCFGASAAQSSRTVQHMKRSRFMANFSALIGFRGQPLKRTVALHAKSRRRRLEAFALWPSFPVHGSALHHKTHILQGADIL